MRNSYDDKKGSHNTTQLHTLQKEFGGLVVKTLLVVIGSWVTLYLFEIFVAPTIGLKHSHFQIAGTVITIAIAFVGTALLICIMV